MVVRLLLVLSRMLWLPRRLWCGSWIGFTSYSGRVLPPCRQEMASQILRLVFNVPFGNICTPVNQNSGLDIGIAELLQAQNSCP